MTKTSWHGYNAKAVPRKYFSTLSMTLNIRKTESSYRNCMWSDISLVTYINVGIKINVISFGLPKQL